MIHNGIYRCFECGQETSLYSVEFKGPWALISCYCPTHEADVKTQKIWSSFFLELKDPEFINHKPEKAPTQEPTPAPKPQEEEAEVPSEEEEKKFCPNCGVQLQGTEKFCGSCGMDFSTE